MTGFWLAIVWSLPAPSAGVPAPRAERPAAPALDRRPADHGPSRTPVGLLGASICDEEDSGEGDWVDTGQYPAAFGPAGRDDRTRSIPRGLVADRAPSHRIPLLC